MLLRALRTGPPREDSPRNTLIEGPQPARPIPACPQPARPQPACSLSTQHRLHPFREVRYEQYRWLTSLHLSAGHPPAGCCQARRDDSRQHRASVHGSRSRRSAHGRRIVDAVAAERPRRSSRRHYRITRGAGDQIDFSPKRGAHGASRSGLAAVRDGVAARRLRRRRAAVPGRIGHAEDYPCRRTYGGHAVRRLFLRHRLIR